MLVGDANAFIAGLTDGADDTYDGGAAIADDTTDFLALFDANVLAAVLDGMGVT